MGLGIIVGLSQHVYPGLNDPYDTGQGDEVVFYA